MKKEIKNSYAFTLADVLMAKRVSDKTCSQEFVEACEPKAPTNIFNKLCAFTLAEVLITLAIIGVVAALTIPTVVRNYQDQQFKTAYKKAYSDLARVVSIANASGEMPHRDTKWNERATEAEWALFKKYFVVQKECNKNCYDCWVNADRVCTGACCGADSGQGGAPWANSKSFIDGSGRSWAQFGVGSYGENIYLVDTNGFKKPNKFGRDRWIFTLAGKNKSRLGKGYAVFAIPYIKSDITWKSDWCNYPPCYYKSWLAK